MLVHQRVYWLSMAPYMCCIRILCTFVVFLFNIREQGRKKWSRRSHVGPCTLYTFLDQSTIIELDDGKILTGNLHI